VVIATVGSTVTFRELHDQLVIKDGSGKAFLKEALKSKTM
jgi:NADH-quinone oxidoreductase subunit L